MTKKEKDKGEKLLLEAMRHVAAAEYHFSNAQKEEKKRKPDLVHACCQELAGQNALGYAQGIQQALCCLGLPTGVLTEALDELCATNKVRQYLLVYTTNNDCGYCVHQCWTKKEARDKMEEEIQKELMGISEYLPTVLRFGEDEVHIVFRPNAESENMADEISQYRIYEV